MPKYEYAMPIFLVNLRRAVWLKAYLLVSSAPTNALFHLHNRYIFVSAANSIVARCHKLTPED